MFCPKCGVKNLDNGVQCIQCGYPLQSRAGLNQDRPGVVETKPIQPGVLSPPPTQLVWAILTTLFCCLPFGIPAIVYSAQVDGKIKQGDYAGALEASHKAKIWCWVAFGSGMAFLALVIMFGILGAILEGSV